MCVGKKHLSVEDQVYVSGTSMLKHFHVRNQRNQRNHCMLGKTVQRDLQLVSLQTSIDYVDYDYYTDYTDYADYESYRQEWQHTDCWRAESRQPLPACAAGSEWCDN